MLLIIQSNVINKTTEGMNYRFRVCEQFKPNMYNTKENCDTWFSLDYERGNDN